MFVKPDSDADGNRALVELGAALLSVPDGDKAGSDWLIEALQQGAAPSVSASEARDQEGGDLESARQPGLFDGELDKP